MNLKMPMERNPYGMTRLHTAAFSGGPKKIYKLFEKHSQYPGNETNQLMAEFMIRDRNGFTPFYIAVARGDDQGFPHARGNVQQDGCLHETKFPLLHV
jgi:hypothetical protein